MLFGKEDLQLVANPMMNMLHEEEVEIANAFYEAAKACNKEKVGELFEVFLYDVEDHFGTEEAMMQQARIFGANIHKEEHDTMRSKLAELKAHWDEHNECAEIVRFLEEEFKPWIILHVARWDSESAMHLGDTM